MDVTVVGSGVIGLTCAVVLAEAGHAVRVRTRDLPRATTSAVAGAMVGPVVPDADPRVAPWSQIGVEEFTRLADDPTTGVRLARGRLATNLGSGTPPWALDIPGYAECPPVPGYAAAFAVRLPIVDMPTYLDHLVTRLAAAGGEVVVDPVTDLSGLSGTVVHATGVAARDVVPDPSVTAGKGQHVVVRNPGLTDFFYEGGASGAEWTGFFPHGDRVLLGSVNLGDSRSLAPDDEAARRQVKRCAAVEPSLADAEVLGTIVGLRPARPSVRLERERVGDADVVHCYGHGGGGVMLSWGSAWDVLRLVG